MSKPYDDLNEMSTRSLALAISAQAGLFIAVGFGLWALSGRDLFAFVTFEAWEWTLGLALGGGMIAVAYATFVLFPRFCDMMTRMQARNYAFLNNNSSAPMILLMSLCAGIGEEALFRGGLQTLLGDYTPLPLAIIVASLAFALIHFAKPLVAGIIFAIGALFGIVYEWSGSLLAVMIGHAVYDIFAIWFLIRQMKRLGLDQQPPREENTPV